MTDLIGLHHSVLRPSVCLARATSFSLKPSATSRQYMDIPPSTV